MPPFFLVDSFTDAPFAGNPAGVVVLDDAAPERWMQRVAAEVGASETAFLHPLDADGQRWDLRWFTPSVEVDLCGHATLASAHVLWTSGRAGRDLSFETRSGTLHARRDDAVLWLDLPTWRVADGPTPAALDTAMRGMDHRYHGRGGDRETGQQHNDVVEVASESLVRTFEPDLAAVAALGSSGLIVTAPADQADDFVSRYFAPNVGVDEDPVTGSAHCTLGPLWAQRLGRSELTARQLSARGGRLHLRVGDDRVEVGGQAVTTIVGDVLAL